MEDELLSLKWNNHQTTFLRIISNLRSKDAYTDATLACNGKFYSVHRFVLSSCSAYFGAIFDQVASRNLVVVLKDITCSTLEYLLEYMYSGEISVRQNELASLVNAAECLRIKGLAVADDEVITDACHNILEQRHAYKFPATHSPTNKHENPKKQRRGLPSNCASDPNKNIRKSIDTEYSSSISDGKTELFQEMDTTEIPDCVEKNSTETSIKQEQEESFLFLECSNLAENDVIKHEENNCIGNLLQNSSTNQVGKSIRKGECIVPSPGSSGTLNTKFQWEFDKHTEAGYGLANSASVISSCLSAIQELPEFLTEETALHSSENYQENSGLFHSSTVAGYRRKSMFEKLLIMGENIPKSHKCKLCSYSCHDASNFKRHLQTHTGEKPYKCIYCNYRCIHSSNLKSHIRYKHS